MKVEPDQLRIQAGISLSGDTLRSEAARARDLLGRWEIVHLRVAFRAAEDIDIPFAGSLLRGGLGAALYRLACVREDLACADCFLRPHCLYPALFEPGDRADGPAPRRGPRARRFAIVPPERISKGPSSFDLKLFGPPPGSMPYLLYALVEMGRAGIGHEKVPLEVERIESLGPPGGGSSVVWEARGLFPERTRPFSAGEVFDASSPSGPPRRIVLDLLTPLRMKEAGRIRSGLTPARLVRAALRRLIDLGDSLGPSWPRGWPGVLEAAGRAVLLGESVRWFDWGRYSRRQDRAMRLGGALGTIEIGDVPGELVPILRTAAFFHLGKNTTFGLGAIELREAP